MSWVLLVEPDQTVVSTVADALTEAGCTTHSLSQISLSILQQTLAQFETQPGVVILDQGVLAADDWQLGRAIKEIESSPFLITLLADPEGQERLRAYDCGSDEIMENPIDIAELVALTQRVLSQRRYTQELEQQLHTARSAAFVAMSTSSRVGQIVRFMQKTMEAKDTQAIATILFEVMETLNLQGTLAVSATQDREYFAGAAAPPPQEIAAIAAADKSKRLLESGASLIIQDKHCTLLLRNMDDFDGATRGQLRDDLCILIEAIESRICGLLLEDEAIRRRSMLDTSLRVLGRILEETDMFNREFTDNSAAIVGDMLEEMNLEFSNVDLNEEEEMRLATLLERSSENLSALFEAKRERDLVVQTILRKLFSAISQ